MSAESVKNKIVRAWSDLRCPDVLLETRAQEEIELAQILQEKKYDELDFWSPPLAGAFLFDGLTAEAQLYYSGGLLLHVLGRLETRNGHIGTHYPFITLTSALEMKSDFHLPFLEQLVAHPRNFECVSAFVMCGYSHPEVCAYFGDEAPIIIDRWKTKERVLERIQELRQSG